MPLRCAFMEGRQQCKKAGTGNPPLCDEHQEIVDQEYEEEEDDMVDNFVEEVMDHPKVQGVFNKVSSVIDRFAHMADNVAAGRRPNGERWSQAESARSAEPAGGYVPPPRRTSPPPKQKRKPPSVEDDAAEEKRLIAEAYVIMGIDPNKPLTADIVKKRKQELSRVYHPDLNSSGSVEMMKRLNAAADLLLATLRR